MDDDSDIEGDGYWFGVVLVYLDELFGYLLVFCYLFFLVFEL